MTENVWRTEVPTGWSRHSKSHWSMEQIACHSTLQVILFVLIMCLLAALLGCSDYQDGMDAYKLGDYATALKKLRPLAEKGNPKAQFWLGWMYSHGEGVLQNDEEAVIWYQRAAQENHAIAQFNLSARYATGQGVVQDREEAVKWYKKALEQGPAGDQVILGVRYANSAGVAQDYGEAVKCIRKAVEQGNPIAQLILGAIYESGTGVDRNYVTAYMWYHRAGILGIEGAHKERDKIIEKMDIVEITNARRLAREWKPEKTD